MSIWRPVPTRLRSCRPRGRRPQGRAAGLVTRCASTEGCSRDQRRQAQHCSRPQRCRRPHPGSRTGATGRRRRRGIQTGSDGPSRIRRARPSGPSIPASSTAPFRATDRKDSEPGSRGTTSTTRRGAAPTPEGGGPRHRPRWPTWPGRHRRFRHLRCTPRSGVERAGRIPRRVDDRRHVHLDRTDRHVPTRRGGDWIVRPPPFLATASSPLSTIVRCPSAW